MKKWLAALLAVMLLALPLSGLAESPDELMEKALDAGLTLETQISLIPGNLPFGEDINTPVSDLLSALSIVFGFPAPILLALMLNEVTNTKFKRTVQTITYMPYFISLVVTCSLIKIYCQENGLFSDIAEFFGGTRQNLMINPGAFRSIYVISGIWQSIGWNSIIYLAAFALLMRGVIAKAVSGRKEKGGAAK